jgi:hypothetical protein
VELQSQELVLVVRCFSKTWNKTPDLRNQFHLHSRHCLFLGSLALALLELTSYCQTLVEPIKMCQITLTRMGLLVRADHQTHPQPQPQALFLLFIVVVMVPTELRQVASVEWLELRVLAGRMEACLCYLLCYLPAHRERCHDADMSA